MQEEGALKGTPPDNGLHPTRISVAFIENLSLPQLCPGG